MPDQLTLTGGALTLGAGGTIGSLQQTGGALAATGTVTLTGASTLSQGQLSSGTLLNQGKLTVGDTGSSSVPGYVVGDGAVLENAGNATVQGTIRFNLTGVLRNDAGATMNIANRTNASLVSANAAQSAFAALFDNQGNLNVGFAAFTVASAFNSSGSITYTGNSGSSLNLEGGGTISGSLTGNGGDLLFESNTAKLAQYTIAAGANVDMGDDGQLLNINGALTIAGAVAAGQNSFVDLGSGTTTNVAAGATLAIQGQLALESQSNLTADAASNIQISELDMSGGNYTGPVAFQTVIVNGNGTLTGTGSAPGTIGSLQFEGGNLNLATNVTAGTLSMPSADTPNITVPGTLSGVGNLTVTGNATVQGGIFAGTGTTVIDGNLTISKPAAGSLGLGIDNGATVELRGTATWNSGHISLNVLGASKAGTLRIDPGAELDATFDGGSLPVAIDTQRVSNTIVFGNTNNATALFDNQGTFRKVAGTGTTTVTVPFTNEGTIRADQGTINFTGAFTNTGAVVLGPTGVVTGTKVDPKLGDLTFQITSGLTPQPTPIKISESSSVSFTLAASDDATVTGASLVAIGPGGTTVLASTTTSSLALTGTVPLIVNNGGSDQLTLELRVSDSRGVTRFTDVPLQLTPAVVPLQLVSQSLVAGATVTDPVSQVSFAFTTPLDPKTVTPASLALSGPGGTTILPTDIVFSNFNRNVLVTYPGLVAGQYTLNVDATKISDQFDNPLGNSVLTTAFTAAPAYSDTWIGAQSGNWGDAANWSTGRVPTATDDVLLNLAPGSAINIGGGSFAVHSLVEAGGGQLTLNFDGSLTVGGRASIADTFTINAGTLNVMDETAIGSVLNNEGTFSVGQRAVLGSLTENLGGVQSGPGTAIVTGAADIESGIMSGPGMLVINGQGTLNVVSLQNGFVLVNQGTTTVVGTSVGGDTTSLLQNAGTLVVPALSSIAINTQLANSGTIQLGAGSSLQTRATTISGIVTGAAGSQLNAVGPFSLTASGQITGANLSLSGNGTIAGSILLPAAGSLTLGGNFDITGAVTGDSSTTFNYVGSLTTTFEAAAAFNVGTVLVNSGTLKFLNSPTIGALTVGGLGTAELDATTTLGALTLNGSGTISGSGTVTVT